MSSSSVVVFSDGYVWEWFIQFGILFGAVLLGNVMRTRIPGLKKMLIPSSLLGGVAILLLKQIPAFSGLIDPRFMQVVTYHCLGLGFAAMALKNARTQKKVPTYKIVESGVIMAGSYLLQAIVGLLISLVMYFTMSYFFGAGLILPMGYGQGTGSALSWGSKYEQVYGFKGGATYGLTVATVGFLVGSLVGVLFLNVLNRKGKLRIRTSKSEENSVEDFVRKNEIPNTESVDKFSLQVCLVALVYLAAYGFMRLLELTGVQAINDLAWGLNFLWALLFGFLVKTVLSLMQKGKIVRRHYINNYLMDRISGFMFDMMIAAGILAIDFEDIRINLPLLVISCTLGAVATFFYVRLTTSYAYKNYETESFLTNFGTVTGTASTGIILLREIDPGFVTPAASNLVLQNIPSVFLLAPLLLTLNFAASSLTHCLIMLGVYTILFILENAYLFRRKLFKKYYRDKPEEIWEDPEA